MFVINYIDSLIQGEQRVIAEPSNSAAPASIIITENSNGTRDITLEWTYTQGENKADTLGLFWEEGASLGVTATPTIASQYVQLSISTRKHIFKGVDPTKAYKVSIAVGYTSENGIIIGTLVRNSLWDVTPGTSNNTNNINGVSAATIVDSLLAITEDGIIDTNEKTAIRSEWTNISTEKAGIDAQATALGITTEKTTYDNAFQTLANFLNAGTTWTSGWPFYINDLQKDVNTTITDSGRNTFITVTRDFYVAKEALNNKMHDIASQQALWTKVASKPATIYNTNEAQLLNINITFANWSGSPALPAGWLYAGATPIRNTTDTNTGECSVQFDPTGGNEYFYSGISNLNIDKSAVVSVTISYKIVSQVSGTTPACICRIFAGAGNNLDTWAPLDGAQGSWQTKTFTARGDNIYNIVALYLFFVPSYNALGYGFTGRVLFGPSNVRVLSGADFDNKKQAATDIQGGIGNIPGQLDASVKLLDASLTAAKTAISAINSSNGNLNTNQLAALQVMVGTLSALSANLGTVTAGTIDTTGYVRARGAISVDGYNSAIVANDSNVQPVGINSRGTYTGEILVGGSYGLLASASNGAGVSGSATTGYGVKGYAPTGVYGLSSSGGYAVHADGILYATSIQTGSSAQVGNLNATYLQGYTPGSFALSSSLPYSWMTGITSGNDYTGAWISGSRDQPLYMYCQIAGYKFTCSGNTVFLQSTSDERLKKNIQPEDLGLSFWRQVNFKSFQLKEGTQQRLHGVIAQDIAEISPIEDNLFIVNPNGDFGVDYNSLFSIGGKALQELDAIVSEQQMTITNLLTRITTLENK